MTCPVCCRTKSALARLIFCTPNFSATAAVSTRCAPDVSTSNGWPSASKTSEFAIWPTSMPSAAAASAAVWTASGRILICPGAPASASAAAIFCTLGWSCELIPASVRPQATEIPAASRCLREVQARVTGWGGWRTRRRGRRSRSGSPPAKPSAPAWPSASSPSAWSGHGTPAPPDRRLSRCSYVRHRR